MSALTPHQWHLRALEAERAGNPEAAKDLVEQGLAEFPDNADLLNSAGNLAMRRGDPGGAAEQFSAALAARPGHLEFAINLSIALTARGRPEAAIAALAPFEREGAKSARYCASRGHAERAAGNPAAAARWYDACLALDPAHARALHGRARVAVERGETTALAHIDRAMASNPGDADLWLAKAQALDVAGDVAGAREIAEQIAGQVPAWLEGLRFLAQLRHAAGESDWSAPFREAAHRLPDDPSIPAEHSAVLAGLDRHEEAASVAGSARRRFPDQPQFALLEAIHAGAAGDDERADRIFADLPLSGAARLVQEARHRIRQARFDAAETLLGDALAEQPWDVGAWALRGLVWRATGQAKASWLHEQAGLIALLPLEDAASVLEPAIARLDALHDGSPMPLGQSLRGGTQTRGLLFDRTEPELQALRQAIEQVLETYRSALPSRDDRHPLLRHREAPWRLAGSWSVRLAGGGDHHTAHIHPQGLLSSACYLRLPERRGPGDGALELGRPAPDLRLDLGPLAVIEPQVGHLALFPSTLYHGTTPFGAGSRMTVAFDVTSVKDGTS